MRYLRGRRPIISKGISWNAVLNAVAHLSFAPALKLKFKAEASSKSSMVNSQSSVTVSKPSKKGSVHKKTGVLVSTNTLEPTELFSGTLGLPYKILIRVIVNLFKN
jgi:hypothetical protein